LLHPCSKFHSTNADAAAGSLAANLAELPCFGKAVQKLLAIIKKMLPASPSRLLTVT